jgi:hypothetical protein
MSTFQSNGSQVFGKEISWVLKLATSQKFYRYFKEAEEDFTITSF